MNKKEARALKKEGKKFSESVKILILKNSLVYHFLISGILYNTLPRLVFIVSHKVAFKIIDFHNSVILSLSLFYPCL